MATLLQKRSLLALALLLAAVPGCWQLSKARTFQLCGKLVARVETEKRVVALTFDDGPEGQGWLVPELKALGVPATFYMIGGGIQADPAGARAIAAAGHELGNHSYSHKRMVLKSPGFIRQEVEETDRLIRGLGYAGPITFRPPYGKKLVGLPIYLASTGRVTVMWDLEPDSKPGPDTAAIVAEVLAGARPGSIILLHGENPATRGAVAPIVKGLKARGFQFLKVSELLAQAAH